MNKQITKIIFYNRWHNGDLFLPKAYMTRLISVLRRNGYSQIYFAHVNNPKSLSDLDVEFFSLNERSIPVDDYCTAVAIEDTLYINTWVGAYKGFFSETQRFTSLISVGIIWTSIFYTIQSILGIQIFNSNDERNDERFIPTNGIPTIDWSKFDIKPADDFVVGKKNIILFCNGHTRSAQTRHSGIQLMDYSVQILAHNHPEYTFVCTQKFNISPNFNNIFFTDDIFSIVQGGDINEIAYLSTFCDIIVGKSSGPHLYCHVQDNINRDCIFFTIGDRQSDEYLYDLYGVKCNHMFFVGNSEQKMLEALHGIISKQLPCYKNTLITNDKFIELTQTSDISNF